SPFPLYTLPHLPHSLPLSTHFFRAMKKCIPISFFPCGVATLIRRGKKRHLRTSFSFFSCSRAPGVCQSLLYLLHEILLSSPHFARPQWFFFARHAYS